MLSPHTQEKLSNIAKTLGLYIYDIEMLKDNDEMILRISITHKAPMQTTEAKSVSVEDCQKMSELVSPLLDVEESQLSDYALEVSSPGLERVLKTQAHYAFSLGELVHVRLMDKSVLEGILCDLSQNHIVIESNGLKQHIDLNDIKKTKVIFAF